MARQLPLIDLARPGAEALLRAAAHRIGFFQLRHPRPELAAEMLKVARQFFALKEEHKLEMDYRQSAAFRGYMPFGVENTAGRTDLREQVELAPEEPAAPPDAWPLHERLRGRNQWPAPHLLPELRPTVERFSEHLVQVAHELQEALCRAVGLQAAALSYLFEGRPHWQMKLSRYIMPPEGTVPDGADGAGMGPPIGVGEHTDSGFLTLLLQDEVGGLQVQSGGEWIDVEPAGPGVLVCNLGEVAEMVTSGYLLATPHRVLLSPSRDRISVPFFYNPQLSATVRRAQLPAGLPWERSELHAERHWRNPQNAHIGEYGLNAFKSLARSHPSVLARHHPDLVLRPDGRLERAAASAG